VYGDFGLGGEKSDGVAAGGGGCVPRAMYLDFLLAFCMYSDGAGRGTGHDVAEADGRDGHEAEVGGRPPWPALRFSRDVEIAAVTLNET